MATLPPPTVRSLLVCERVVADPDNPRRLSLLRLMSSVRPAAGEAYPLLVPELTVFTQLTGCRGTGRLRAEVVDAHSDAAIARSPDQPIRAGNDPLAVRGAVFRFPRRVVFGPGLYLVRLTYNDGVLAETPLLFHPPSLPAPRGAE